MRIVRRIVLIIITLTLLLLSEAVTLMATRAATSHGPVKVDNISFYYKLDEKARFLDLKTQWQSEHRGELPLGKAVEIATEAYNTAATESPFEMWRYHGGPAPNVFTSKAHIYNQSRTALLNVPVTVLVRAKVGELRVNPAIQMTDFEHLEDSAQWETISKETIMVPALAPGEDLLLPVLQFRLLEFLARHPNHWPAQLELKLTSPLIGTAYKSISLVPDHFVVPVLY